MEHLKGFNNFDDGKHQSRKQTLSPIKRMFDTNMEGIIVVNYKPGFGTLNILKDIFSKSELKIINCNELTYKDISDELFEGDVIIFVDFHRLPSFAFDEFMQKVRNQEYDSNIILVGDEESLPEPVRNRSYIFNVV